jgi:hypothetical protein
MRARIAAARLRGAMPLDHAGEGRLNGAKYPNAFVQRFARPDHQATLAA